MAKFLKNAGTLLVIVSALTLATWVFFYFAIPEGQLHQDSTYVVFGGWLAVAFTVQFLYKRLRRKQ
jgi:uncharacterized membrane protein